MDNKRLIESQKTAFENCKMLYSDRNRGPRDSLMCFGWEMGVGWFDKMRDLSMRLEALNLLFYPKFGVRVVMEQSKQKWGRLTNYFRVETEPHRLVRMANAPFKMAFQWLSTKVDYGLKRVIDDEGGDYEDREEIPDKDVEKAKEDAKRFHNVRIESSDGKWFKVTKLHRSAAFHYEPSKNRVLFEIKRILWKITSYLDFAVEPTVRQSVIAEAVELEARKIIDEYERECYNVCELCGMQIGTKWSPRIQTKGWVSYICDSCDAKRRISHAKDTIKGLDGADSDDAISSELGTEIEKIGKLTETDDFVSSADLAKAANRIEEIAKELSEKNSNEGAK